MAKKGEEMSPAHPDYDPVKKERLQFWYGRPRPRLSDVERAALWRKKNVPERSR